MHAIETLKGFSGNSGGGNRISDTKSRWWMSWLRLDLNCYATRHRNGMLIFIRNSGVVVQESSAFVSLLLPGRPPLCPYSCNSTIGLWRVKGSWGWDSEDPSGVDPVNLFRGHWTRPYKVFVILSCVKQFHMQKSLHILSLQFIVLGQLSLTYHLSQHVAAGVLVADTTQADFPATTSSYSCSVNTLKYMQKYICMAAILALSS